MEELARQLLDFIQTHQHWAIAIMFITAFGESFAFLSLLFPGTTLLVAAGRGTARGVESEQGSSYIRKTGGQHACSDEPSIVAAYGVDGPRGPRPAVLSR